MIDFFRTWLPQIIGYAEMIADEGSLRKAWLRRDLSETSVYYPGELIEQVYGDLDSDNLKLEMAQRLAPHSSLVQAIEQFLHRMVVLDAWADANMDTKAWGEGKVPADADYIFRSDEWRKLKEQGVRVVALAHAAGFRSSDFRPVP